MMLFVLAAVAEIGDAWLGWREHRGVVWSAGGIVALGAYGFVATFQPDPHFGRVLAAYGGIFVTGSLAWGAVADSYRPDRFRPSRRHGGVLRGEVRKSSLLVSDDICGEVRVSPIDHGGEDRPHCMSALGQCVLDAR